MLKTFYLLVQHGFLGAHILDNYLSTTKKTTIYCIVRKKDLIDPEERIRKILNFYFGNKYDKMIGHRIKVVPADITLENLGMSSKEYDKLAKKVDIVINSAALVKHYGRRETFYNANVLGTQKLIDLCKKYKKKLYHVSTASVSGLGVETSSNRINFSERDLYTEQNLDNIYIRTKFEAERLVLENIESGLEATILRLGNISNRYSDAKFQINVSENAFVNKMKSILKLEVLQESVKNLTVEFAPVDLCADAIVRIIKSNPKFTVFHICNNKLIKFRDIVKYISSLDLKLDFVSDEEFSKKIGKFLKDSNMKNEISGLAIELDSNNNIAINNSVFIDCSFTTEYLEKLGFAWKEIDKDYIKKYIEYFKEIKYFD